MTFKQKLADLRDMQKERAPKGWDDYEWCTEKGDFVRGQISILEELIE